MTDPRTFPTTDVISATTGILVSDDGIAGVHELLDYVLGDTLFTHQLPAASIAATPHLAEQHPWLNELKPPQGDLDALRAWLRGVLTSRGTHLDITPAVDPDWHRGRALSDAVDMFGADRVIPVIVDNEADS